jgi:acetolactate synthase-1/2/3 large subunit
VVAVPIETAVRYKVPLIAIIYNNNCWGSCNFSRNAPRSMQLHLFQENLRYDKVAEGLGARGEYVHTPEGFRAALQRAYDTAVKESLPTVINCQGHRLFSQASAYQPGTMFNPEPGIGALMH